MNMQIGSTTWVIVGYLIIAGGLLIGGLMVHHGSKLNQKISETKILGQQKESETTLRNTIKDLETKVATLTNQNTMLSILERMQRFFIIDHDILSKKYPKGYFLFASNKYTLIPSNKEVKSNFRLDWDRTKVQFINDSFIYIILKSFHYIPNGIEVVNLNIILERKIGSVADGIYFENIGLLIEILDDKIDSLIYVIGFKEVKSIPKSIQINLEVDNFIKGLGVGPLMPAINSKKQKNIRIQDMTIASGWKPIQN